MAAEEGRVEPLEGDDGRVAPAPGRPFDRVEPRAQAVDQLPGARAAADALADVEDVGEDVLEACRIEREDLGAPDHRRDGVTDLSGRDGADGAELLGEEEVGRELGQALLVEGVEARAGGELRRDRGVDLLRRHAGREGAAGEDRPRPRLRRIVALVRHADDVVAGAQGEEDLGGVRD